MAEIGGKSKFELHLLGAAAATHRFVESLRAEIADQPLWSRFGSGAASF